MPTYPTAEESIHHLHREGWSVGDVGTAGGSWRGPARMETE
jgi:hypothetical protein